MEELTRADLLRRGGYAAGLIATGPALGGLLGRSETAADPRLRALARAVRGPVIRPESTFYDTVRLPQNARFASILPLAVVQPLDPHDVQEVVRWASRTGVPIAARSGGHSYAGYSTTRGVVVDLRRMAGVRVDRDGHAVVGAGARLGNVYAALGGRGRAIPAGSCPSVGIAGLTLGGGFGLTSRAWGLTCDTLVRAEVVTADGRRLMCDRRRHPDLFWALRGGGGGNFGIVTRLVFRTHRVSTASRFTASWAWDDVEDVLEAFLRWLPGTPDALTAICRLSTAAGTPAVQVFGQYLGTQAALQTVVARLTQDLPPLQLTTATSPWLALVRHFGGCGIKPLSACSVADPYSFAAGSNYLARRPAVAGRRALKRAIENRGGERASILLDGYGGAVNRVAPSATAFVHRGMLASVQYFARAAGARGWVRATRRSMRPHVSGQAYQNYIDPDLRDWARAYYGANLRRLRRVKRKYDPENLFRFAQSVR
jgi:FAD/FMN-containing dehydrogenase